MKNQNKLMQWIKSHAKQSICITIVIVLTIGFSIFMAVQVQPEPETKAVTEEVVDNGKQILDTVNKNVDTNVDTNVDANEHIADETKESTKETTESAQSKTETKPAETVKPDNTGNTSTGNGSGNKSGSNTGGTKQGTSKSKERVWVPEQGHYEDITEKVWVPNIVTIVVTPEITEKVFDYMEYYFPEDNYSTTDADDCDAHALELGTQQGYYGNFQHKEHYKYVTTPAVTKQEDHGSHQTKVVGQKWVVDVPGHWE